MVLEPSSPTLFCGLEPRQIWSVCLVCGVEVEGVVINPVGDLRSFSFVSCQPPETAASYRSCFTASLPRGSILILALSPPSFPVSISKNPVGIW